MGLSLTGPVKRSAIVSLRSRIRTNGPARVLSLGAAAVLSTGIGCEGVFKPVRIFLRFRGGTKTEAAVSYGSVSVGSYWAQVGTSGS
jgi:hypothetical protein